MRCDEVQEKLDTPKSSTEPETQPVVDTHVEACSSCQEFSEDLHAVEKAFASVPEERISQQGSVRLRNSIAMMIADKERELQKVKVAQAEPAPSFLDRVFSLFTVPMAAQGLATCAVVAFGVFTYNLSTDVPAGEAPVEVAQVPTAPSRFPTSPVETARVKLLEGKVIVAGLPLSNSTQDPLEVAVAQGQTLMTAPGHEAQIELENGVRVHLDPSSRISLSQGSLSLQAGRTGVHVPKGAARGFTVLTPSTEAVILGTRVLVEDTGRVDLLEGTVRVGSKQSGVAVQPAPGESVVFDAESGSLVVESTGEFRMNFLYRVFGELDTPAEVARDLGVSIVSFEKALTDGKALVVARGPLSGSRINTFATEVDLTGVSFVEVPTVVQTPATAASGVVPVGELEILGAGKDDSK